MSQPIPTNEISEILKHLEYFKPLHKKQAEFVITRYNESLEWTRGIEHLTTIYNKGSPIEGAIHVPNYGYGLETMLRHIITRYDSLADVTFFAQGNIADRKDQPMYPLYYYFQGMNADKIRAVLTLAYDIPKSRYRSRLTDPDTFARDDITLEQFRRNIGIPYKLTIENWVKGDWISVGRNLIRSKPKAYYCYLYSACKFGRGTIVEECWFLERSFYSIFTEPIERSFLIPACSEDVILS
jgi:hypothetical protein